MVKRVNDELPIGWQAPDFALPNTHPPGEIVRLGDYSNVGVVVMFICNHCPYVVHIQEKLLEVARHYQAQDIQFIAISANDVETYPQDGPDMMSQVAQNQAYPFPYVFDEKQQVAKSYGAVCTPEFFVLDAARKLVYHGRFDASTPGNQEVVSGEALAQALEALLVGQVLPIQHPSMGCSIKWKRHGE